MVQLQLPVLLLPLLLLSQQLLSLMPQMHQQILQQHWWQEGNVVALRL